MESPGNPARFNVRAVVGQAKHLLVVLRVEPVLEEGSAHELQRSVKHQESDVREALVLQRRDECAQCRDQLIGMPEPSSTLP